MRRLPGSDTSDTYATRLRLRLQKYPEITRPAEFHSAESRQSNCNHLLAGPAPRNTHQPGAAQIERADRSIAWPVMRPAVTNLVMPSWVMPTLVPFGPTRPKLGQQWALKFHLD